MTDRSPYAPPLSAVEITQQRKGAPWKAVLLGLLVDIGGTMLMGVAVSIVVYVAITRGGVPQAEIEQLFASPTTPLVIALTILGGLLSLLGGYVCARIARHNELKLGGVMAFFSVLIGILLGINNQVSVESLLLHAATIAAVLFGSWLGMRRNRRS